MRLRNAVIIDGVRTAFTKAGRGKLDAARLDDIGAYLIRTLFERNPKVKPTMIEDVGIGGALGRGVGHLAGLPAEITDFTSERACATSQETAMRISMGIMLGQYDFGISVGVERMGTYQERLDSDAGLARLGRRDGPNPKTLEVTQYQRDMPPQPFRLFLGTHSGLHSGLSERRLHGTDRTECMRDVRPDP